MMAVNVIVAFVAAIGLLASKPLPTELVRELASETLAIETPGGLQHFTVEMARTSEEQSRGLMYRTSMADDRGMLFPLKRSRRVSFWMKNTYLPLDMLFIDRQGTILQIEADAEPLTETQRISHQKVAAILEINGGLSARLGIVPGQRVRHAFFGTADQ